MKHSEDYSRQNRFVSPAFGSVIVSMIFFGLLFVVFWLTGTITCYYERMTGGVGHTFYSGFTTVVSIILNLFVLTYCLLKGISFVGSIFLTWFFWIIFYVIVMEISYLEGDVSQHIIAEEIFLLFIINTGALICSILLIIIANREQEFIRIHSGRVENKNVNGDRVVKENSNLSGVVSM